MVQTLSMRLLGDGVEPMIVAGDMHEVISGSKVNPSVGLRVKTFPVKLSQRRMAVSSMIAPSSGWFVGVSCLEFWLGRQWVNKVVVG